MKRFCGTCNKEHDIDDWYPILTYGIREPTAYHCEKFLKQEVKPKLRGKADHVPESLKQDRKRFAKSMLQPWREGEPSAEFIEAYPKQAKKMFTPKEMAKAKNVWKGEPNYDNWRKSE